MHDESVIVYSVNVEEKTIIIQMRSNEGAENKICFREVLTHSFKCILDYNLIMDIQEVEISRFISDHYDELIKMKSYCWPIDYNTEQDLLTFLITNKYKYIKINSSYGMYGWILAKSYEKSS